MPSDLWPRSIPPLDSAVRQAVRPVITYPVDQLPPIDAVMFQRAKEQMTLIQSLTIPPRDAQAFRVPKGHFFRIVSIEGPQVGDLNLWHADNLQERFFREKPVLYMELISQRGSICGQIFRICARWPPSRKTHLIGTDMTRMAAAYMT